LSKFDPDYSDDMDVDAQDNPDDDEYPPPSPTSLPNDVLTRGGRGMTSPTTTT
jgi:hypothetical protein